MTTPERLRRRQRRESIGIAILAFGLVGSVAYFDRLDAAQERCISAFIKADNDTSAIRSQLVERESKATRTIIRTALSAESREDVIKAREAWLMSLAEIDLLRDQNPVEEFDRSVCE